MLFWVVWKQGETLEQNAGANSESHSGNDATVQSLCGICASIEVDIVTPMQAKNKGSGKSLKGGKEKAIEVKVKPKHICRSCNQPGHHDSYNFPTQMWELNDRKMYYIGQLRPSSGATLL